MCLEGAFSIGGSLLLMPMMMRRGMGGEATRGGSLFGILVVGLYCQVVGIIAVAVVVVGISSPW